MKHIETGFISEMSAEQMRAMELEMAVQQHNEQVRYMHRFDHMIGKMTSWRTATYHTTGILEAVHKDHVVLSDATWVADAGDWTKFLTSGVALDFCHVPADQVQLVWFDAMVDASVIPCKPKK